MVKKKRKIKQKRADSQERPSVPATPEQVPLYIEVATPHEDEKPAGLVTRPDSRRSDSGDDLVSGSIVGLASGEIHVDPGLALSVHFGDTSTLPRKPSVEVTDEGAILEELVSVERGSIELENTEAPTPAPLVSPTQLQERHSSPAVAESMPETAPKTAEENRPRRRKRRNTLPQVGSVPLHPAVVTPDQDTLKSEGYSVFSGEIEIVPEEDSPPAVSRAVPPPLPAAVPPPAQPEVPEPPLTMGLPEEAEFSKSMPMPVQETVGIGTPSESPAEAAPREPESAPEQEGSLSPEEIEAMQRQREQRREQLRKLVASLPLPFAMNLPDKAQKPSDAGFAPAVPAAALPPLESKVVEASPPAAPQPVQEDAPIVPAAPPAAPQPVQEDAPIVPAAPPAVPQPVQEDAQHVSAESSKTKKVATPLENSLVSTQMGAAEPMMSGRLRASSRSDIPVKGFSDMEEEFFDKEIHPENDYSGLDEVFANIQEQQANSGGLLGSLRRLFVADAPLQKGAPGKPKNGNASKGKNGKKDK